MHKVLLPDVFHTTTTVKGQPAWSISAKLLITTK